MYVISGYAPEQRKLALNDLQSVVVRWMRDHGDVFPDLRDALHEVDVAIDEERFK